MQIRLKINEETPSDKQFITKYGPDDMSLT